MTTAGPKPFDEVLARTNRANEELLNGRSELLKTCFSHAAEATVFGGFGGHDLGWDEIRPRLDWVGESFAGGHCDYETLSVSVGADLALVVQFERGEARIRGRTAPLRLDFRVTMAFRLEDGEWKLLHRHADPLIEKQRPV